MRVRTVLTLVGLLTLVPSAEAAVAVHWSHVEPVLVCDLHASSHEARAACSAADRGDFSARVKLCKDLPAGACRYVHVADCHVVVYGRSSCWSYYLDGLVERTVAVA